MSVALDLIKGALRRISSYQPGDTLNVFDQNDALESLNDMLDSWSTDKLYIYGSNENILQWVPGKNQYRIGNPSNALLSLPNIVGTVSGNTITTTFVPSHLVSGTSSITASTISDLQNVVPEDTYVTGTTATTITLSNPITSSASGSDTFYWTVPGDFGIARPLRITYGFTRFNALDFPFEVKTTLEQYQSILYKAQPGPWPIAAWYNNQYPYGILNVYQTPGQASEVHLFTDTILSNLTLSQQIVLPQGYARAIKWCLAEEIWPEYWPNVPIPPSLSTKAKQSLDMIKALNSQPASVATYDPALTRSNRGDAGFIFHGGYGR